MEALLIYFAKVLLSSTVLFAYYHLMLRDRTFHHYNRFYLLGIVVNSVLLPLLKLSYFTLEVNDDIYLLLNNLQNFKSTNDLNNDNLYFGIISSIFGLVSVLLLVKFFIGIIQVKNLKRQFPKENFEGFSFYQTNLENAPFSFFRNLFWKNTILLNSDLGRQILKHEMVHIEQKHSFDKVFIEVVIGIFWFNPVFWMIKKEINLIHEYLADKKAVRKSDTKAFAQMLLGSHFSGNVLPGTSPFLSSNLKKRLKMLQKPTTKFGYAHRILALPLIFTLTFAYAVNAKNKEIKETNAFLEQRVAEFKKDTVKPTIEAKLLDINKKNISENENMVKDSTSKYVVSSVYKEGNLDKKKVFSSIENSSENDVFKIEKKSVSKEEFIKFFNGISETKNYIYGYSNTFQGKQKKLFFIDKRPTEAEFEKTMDKLRKKIIDEKVNETVNTAVALSKSNENWKVENNFDAGALKMKIKMEQNTQNNQSNPWTLNVKAQDTTGTKKQMQAARNSAYEAARKAAIASKIARDIEGTLASDELIAAARKNADETRKEAEEARVKAVINVSSLGKNYSILTKKEDGKIKYYVNGVEMEKPALDAELKVSAIKYVNVEKGENGNRIYIVTKK